MKVPKLRFKDEDGKAFPEWEEKRLGEIAEIAGGGTPDTAKNEYWDGEIDWYTPTEIKAKYLSQSLRKITSIGLRNSSAKLIPAGSVIFTSRATVGEVAIALKECTTNQGFQSFITKNSLLNEFLYYWIVHHKNVFIKYANGSTFLEISKTSITAIDINLPSLPEQTKIANFLSAVDEKIQLVEQKITSMQRWKNGLMQQLFI